MRPLEKRIAAIEARTQSPESASLIVLYCPEDVDPDVFAAEKKAELGHDRFRLVCFVASDGHGKVKRQPWHCPTAH